MIPRPVTEAPVDYERPEVLASYSEEELISEATMQVLYGPILD